MSHGRDELTPAGPVATREQLDELQDAIGHELRSEELELLEEPDPEGQHQAFAAVARERRKGGRR